jgi:hypothetical protein
MVAVLSPAAVKLVWSVPKPSEEKSGGQLDRQPKKRDPNRLNGSDRKRRE